VKGKGKGEEGQRGEKVGRGGEGREVKAGKGTNFYGGERRDDRRGERKKRGKGEKEERERRGGEAKCSPWCPQPLTPSATCTPLLKCYRSNRPYPVW